MEVTLWLIRGETLKQFRVSGLYVGDCKEWVNHGKFSKQNIFHMFFCRLGNGGTIFPTLNIPSHIIFQLGTQLTTD